MIAHMICTLEISVRYMNTKRTWIAIILIALVVTVVVSTGNRTPDAKIKVGVILPLSGQYGAAFGESVRNSMQMSFNNLEDKNIELIFEDGQFDSAKALSAYNKLQSVDNVDIIIGLDSPTLETIKPIVNKSDELLLTVGNEATVEADNVFEVIPWAAGLFRDLGKAVSGRYGKVAVIYANDWSLAQPNKKLFLEGLGHTNYIEVAVAQNSDVRTEITKMLAQGVDAYTVFLPIEQGSKVINEISKQSGSKRPQLICDGNIELTIGDFLKKVNDTSVFDGCVSTMIADSTEKEYVAQYKQVFGSEPNFLGVYGYDAVQIISKTLAHEEKSEWRKVLEKTNFSFKGASGTITFDETGSRDLVSDVKVFRDGKFVKLLD